MPRLTSLTLAAAQYVGSTAERMFLSHMNLRRLSCPALRRLTVDVAVDTMMHAICLPRGTPVLESCALRMASHEALREDGMHSTMLGETKRVVNHPKLVELRVAGAGCTTVYVGRALLQLPQLKLLSLHNMVFRQDEMATIASCAPGLRELHVSGWLNKQDKWPLFAPNLTRKLVREALALQHLQCLQLTVCSRPSYAPPQRTCTPERAEERRLKNAGLRIVRHRANRRMWTRLWERARPEVEAPQLILRRSRLHSCA